MERSVRSFRINKETWEDLKILADRLGVSRGELLRRAIRWMLANPTLTQLMSEEVV